MSTVLPERLAAAHLRGLDHAHDLASRGWKIVPYLDEPDGRQITGWSSPDGSSVATDDPDQIERWFGPGAPYEDAYVGIVPGLVGITCIDYDNHGDDKPNGFDSARAYTLPTTALVSGTSRSGKGKHLWYLGVRTSKPIYPGVDAKSKGGLVRVPYLLPEVSDIYEKLPRVFEINNVEVTGREFLGSVQSWLDLHAGKPITSAVSSALRSLPSPFTGHPDMLRVQTRLVKLAGEGEGGVPEALEQAFEAWKTATHSSGEPVLDWARALAGAVTSFGGDAPKIDGRRAPVARFEDLHEWNEDAERWEFAPNKAAKALSPGMALGVDSRFYEYAGGIFLPDVGKPNESTSTRAIRRRLNNILPDKTISNNTVATVESKMIDNFELPRLSSTPDLERVNLANCTYLWRTHTVEDHSPEHLSTTQIPVQFDDAATCPKFDAWLSKVVPTDSLAMTWEALGYALMPGNPYQMAFLLHGPGGTGKSTFLRLLEHMLGHGNVSNLSLKKLSESGFAVAELQDKLANICGDLDAKFLEDSSPFKQLTGQDTVSTARKYGAEFTFRPYAVPIFSANELWRSSDTTDSYFRRWTILPFPNKVKDTDPDFLEEDLLAEAPGIFNKAMANLRVLMDRGAFQPSSTSMKLFEQFRTEADVVLQWLSDDELVMSDAGNDGLRVSQTSAYSRFQVWAEDAGVKGLGKQHFNKRLTSLGYPEARSNGQRQRVGIKVTESSMWNLH
jgi:putative DNA primase/helicase